MQFVRGTLILLALTFAAGCKPAPETEVDTDIDECTAGTDDCVETIATCTNGDGSFTCACLAGYTGDGTTAGTGCADVDECTDASDTCVETIATCTNDDGSFTCACNAGYTGDGTTSGTGCTDIDECTLATHDCVALAKCANTLGSFACTCPFTLTGDGKTGGTGCTSDVELLHYQFDGLGTSVPNVALNPPAGTATATLMGGLTQGAGGQCGGALIGTGVANTDYLDTGWATSLGTGAWTISFWSKGISTSNVLFYVFGGALPTGFRCFTNGVAGATNWVIRGPGLSDTYINGGALGTPTMNTFVYDPGAANLKGYLNGTLVTTVAQGALDITESGPFKVMGNSTNRVGAPAGGLLDEFRVYSRALMATEVANLYAATCPP